MEVLYKKLYDKYNNLKGKKISQLDQSNNDLEKKFQEYLTAADAYIAELNGENQKLRADINRLQIEVVSLRSENDQKYEDSQKLLSKERQKNEELTKEIDHLLKLQQEEQNQNQETFTPQDTLARKRRRLSGEASDTVSTELVRSHIHHSKISEPSVSISKENIYNADHQEPQCCRSSNDSGSCNCLFQVLVECFTGMQVSVVRQSDGVGICALHQSSGYSFELTWVKAGTDETQLLYQVSSLGTFDKIAPEWMREAIIFSMNMCPKFFQRVSRVIKLKHP